MPAGFSVSTGRQTRLEYNVRKVYPYARIAAGKVNEIEQKLSAVTREADRKKITRKNTTS